MKTAKTLLSTLLVAVTLLTTTKVVATLSNYSCTFNKGARSLWWYWFLMFFFSF